MTLCPWCRQQYEPASGRRCPHCGAVPPDGEARSAPTGPEPGGASVARTFLDLVLGPEGTGLPWENRADWGALRGLVMTLRAVLLSPLRAFRVMRRDGSSRSAAVYSLIVGGAALALVGLRSAIDRPPLEIALVLLAAPLAALVFPAAAALGAHVFLRLCARARPLALSYRVSCYALGSAAALAVLPFCGHSLAAFWYLAVASTGFFVVHRAGVLAALGAALVPPLALAAAAAAGAAVLAAAWRFRA